MCGGAKSIKNGPWFDMKPIARIMLPNLQVVKMKAHMLEVRTRMTRNPIFART
jgi:hypothetical protein